MAYLRVSIKLHSKGSNFISGKCSGWRPKKLNAFSKDNGCSGCLVVILKFCIIFATRKYINMSATYFPMQYRGPKVKNKENGMNTNK